MERKEKLNELIEREKRTSVPIYLIIPLALTLFGPLWFVASILGRQEHNISTYIISIVCAVVLVWSFKEHRKNVQRIKELRKELL